MVAIKPIKVKKTLRKDAAAIPIYTSPTKTQKTFKKTFTLFTTKAGTLKQTEHSYTDKACPPKRTSCLEDVGQTQKTADNVPKTTKKSPGKRDAKSQVRIIINIHMRYQTDCRVAGDVGSTGAIPRKYPRHSQSDTGIRKSSTRREAVFVSQGCPHDTVQRLYLPPPIVRHLLYKGPRSELRIPSL
ncbi:hypothetical protein SCHPADRAFT_948246 [Schizopora paradoxa]|uniref:Uncharacterized protein n=1 Tax=Schizopora paradoxa TaxID=27342 RepID=A0A0H2R306_9AGAM|nr:hypothetical protein SCHPADRAFT_948246 [Schizopora paradoxa]